MLQKIWKFSFVALFAASLLTALHPDIRAQVRGTLLNDYRMVVSSANGDLLSDGTPFNIIKIKTRDDIFLEVYRSSQEGKLELVEKIQMPQQRDGYFSFNGEATNLAVDDIDGDGRPEILVPSFDRDLVGHLNVFRFDPTAKNFQKVLL